MSDRPPFVDAVESVEVFNASPSAHAAGLAGQRLGAHLPLGRDPELIRDPRESLQRLAQVLPVRRLRPRQPAGQGWRHRLQLPLGETLPIWATELPPLSLQVDARPDQHLTAVLVQKGSLRLRQRGGSWLSPAGSLALLSAEPFVLSGGPAHCLILALHRPSLLREGAALLGRESPPSGWSRLLTQEDGRQLSALAAVPALSGALGHGLQLALLLGRLQPSLPDRLPLERLIHGLVALMLFPELRRRPPLERLSERHQLGRDAFDDLLEQIQGHLHEPLSLDWLAKASNYSPRTLQYKFRHRLGCTATDWIRSQRLDRARDRLQHPQQGDTVARIASLCGYRSVNLFSVDFQQRFHVRPSDLLREAQRQGVGLSG